MERLLTLPVELRLRIYNFALRDQQFELDMVEYWENSVPDFWQYMAEPLAKMDSELASDIWALHWSRVTIQYSEYMGDSVLNADRYFASWLYNYAEPVIDVLGVLRFREVTRVGSHVWPPAEDHANRCIDTMDIFLKTGNVEIRDRHDRECTCKHATYTLARIQEVLDKIPRKRGRLQLKPDDLWTFYEYWSIKGYQQPLTTRLWKHVSTAALLKK